MASRLWRKGLIKASQWGWHLAQEGFQIPVPQTLLDRLIRKVADPTLRDLRMRIAPDDRLILTGLKKKGIWVEFQVTFALEAPTGDEPDRSLALRIAEAAPVFARGAARSALAEVEEISAGDDRILVDLDRLIDRHEWARKIPRALRDRLRITQAHTQGERLYLRISLG